MCQLSLWGPLGEGLKGSQVSRFLVKGTRDSVVHSNAPVHLYQKASPRSRGSDPSLLDCEPLEGGDQGPEN